MEHEDFIHFLVRGGRVRELCQSKALLNHKDNTYIEKFIQINVKKVKNNQKIFEKSRIQGRTVARHPEKSKRGKPTQYQNSLTFPPLGSLFSLYFFPKKKLVEMNHIDRTERYD